MEEHTYVYTPFGKCVSDNCVCVNMEINYKSDVYHYSVSNTLNMLLKKL